MVLTESSAATMRTCDLGQVLQNECTLVVLQPGELALAECRANGATGSSSHVVSDIIVVSIPVSAACGRHRLRFLCHRHPCQQHLVPSSSPAPFLSSSPVAACTIIIAIDSKPSGGRSLITSCTQANGLSPCLIQVIIIILEGIAETPTGVCGAAGFISGTPLNIPPAAAHTSSRCRGTHRWLLYSGRHHAWTGHSGWWHHLPWYARWHPHAWRPAWRPGHTLAQASAALTVAEAG